MPAPMPAPAKNITIQAVRELLPEKMNTQRPQATAMAIILSTTPIASPRMARPAVMATWRMISEVSRLRRLVIILRLYLAGRGCV